MSEQIKKYNIQKKYLLVYLKLMNTYGVNGLT